MSELLKLYHWGAVGELSDAAPGEAFALATSSEQAVELVVAERMSDLLPRDRYPDTASYDKLAERLRTELTTKQPKVFDKPVGIVVWGSA